MQEYCGFSSFPISPNILKAIEDMGFEEPTPIQKLAIPQILEGKDVTGQAQTGTGKTAAFGIPLVEKISPEDPRTQALILSPTRELALQTSGEIKRLSRHQGNLSVVPIYGGQPIGRQFGALRHGAQIIVGTPGRVIDHLERGTLSLDAVQTVVLDEADQMLDMGFREDIERILSETPEDRQTVLFSATMPGPIRDISRRFQRDPAFVRVQQKEMTVPQVEQLSVTVRGREKPEVLSMLLQIYNPELTIVFCNTKQGVDDLTTQLHTLGVRAEALHGGMKQVQRDRVMGRFRNDAIDVLIATDVAARGIDVEDVELVINYDLPQDIEYYIHRIGRTARAGRGGRAITFVGPRDGYRLRAIQRHSRARIHNLPVPTKRDVEESRMRNLAEKVRQTIEEGDLDRYAGIVDRVIGEDDLSAQDVAAALLKMMLSHGTTRPKSTAAEPEDRGEVEVGMTRLHLNAGKDRNIRPKDIVGALAGETGIPGRSIGAIRIEDNNTFVEVPEESAKTIVERMKGKSIGSVRLIGGTCLTIATPTNR
ncbi:DEAD/DEAH box helicase [Methanofollis aquaemaris]|uniref:RNA helicase n=1 Tax=Methanofollis aquaemaris TaxID=126734 RepID=A0A8A3S2A7_9EURY|nr:DEAD/DEAH box helicase [Methanofollis aquaemaris]QSZ66477.1 DEAD/DEAH box helicase [Methanofollis aquaemaris]